jgi:hypothetical protein
MGCLENQIA